MKDPKHDLYKACALDSDLDVAYAAAKRKEFFDGDSFPLVEFLLTTPRPLIKAAQGIYNARIKRKQRVKKKVAKSVFSDNAWFSTLTWRNEQLEKCGEKERRRKVARLLKRFCVRYAANIDFGDKKKNPQSHEREHYHAILEFKEGVDPQAFKAEWQRLYGWLDLEKVGKTEKDLKKVAAYTAKLTAHSLKRSTSKGAPRAPRLIYSRNCIK